MPRVSLRQKILNAALEQFHIYGYNGTGIKDITDSAGAPKGSFYNHLPSKEACAILILEEYGASLPVAMLRDTSKPPIERLRLHFETMRDQSALNGFTRGCLMGNVIAEVGDHSDSLRKTALAGIEAWIRQITSVVSEARACGDISSSVDPDAYASFLVTSWEGAILLARASKSDFSYENFLSIMFDNLLARPA